MHGTFHLSPEGVRGERTWDWLIKICFERKIKSLLTTAQDLPLSLRNIRKAVDKEQTDVKCKVCGE